MTPRANRLNAETIEAKEGIHHWRRNNVVDDEVEMSGPLKEASGLSN